MLSGATAPPSGKTSIWPPMEVRWFSFRWFYCLIRVQDQQSDLVLDWEVSGGDEPLPLLLLQHLLFHLQTTTASQPVSFNAFSKALPVERPYCYS